MQCPKCAAENREGRKFCAGCGAKLILPCVGCGAENLPGEKFCGDCGCALSPPASKAATHELSFDEKISKLQKYLPGGLTEKILSQRGKIEGERRQVTVLFADMENFTPLVENLGPEEAYAVMDQVYEILIHKVHEFEGTVNEMTGDGIMALFGAPIALEDAPQRAIRAALAIHREIARFSEKTGQEKATSPLRMRIGIHTGPVVVGTLGNDLRVEFKAVGETVNLASRLQNLAEAGTTCVTADTFALTEGLFRFEALGDKTVKGKEQPVRVYQVIAPTSSRTRFDVAAERGLTPLVGRSRELELLLDGFDRARQGRGQAFSIIGEAGVGKSRLLYEFRKALANEGVTFLEGKCLSYGRGAAFHPISDILKGAFDIAEGESDARVQRKVQSGLEALEVPAPSALPYILELLGVKESGIERILLSPEGKKDRFIENLKHILLKSAQVRPLIVAVEDLHWADKSSENVLKVLLEGIPGAQVLLVLTYRPEFVHSWGGKSYHNQLTLNRLSNRESLAMAASLMGSDQLDKELEELILSRTEGVPFFIEEFIKSLKDLDIISQEEGRFRLAKWAEEVKIPSTIQDMIMARVDGMPTQPKELLQIGSVIEREFGYDLVKQAAGLDDNELVTGFAVLKEAELLYERGIFPHSTYIFKHALTREVVYDSLLEKKKKMLHEAIGTAIEQLDKDNLDQRHGLLAAHFTASENYVKAAGYARLAGKRAEKSASFADAIAFAQKSVVCLGKLTPSEEIQKRIIDTRAVLGLYLLQLNKYIEAKQAVEPVIEPAIKQKNKKRICQIKIILGTYFEMVEEDFPAAYEAFEEAIKIADETGDIVGSFFANHHYAIALSFDCKFDKALHHMTKALEINLDAKNAWGIAITKGNLGFHCLALQGNIASAFQHTAEAIQMAEETGDVISKAYTYSAHGISCLFKGYLVQAEKYLRMGIDFCERLDETGWNASAHVYLAEAYAAIGRWADSVKCCQRLCRLIEESRTMPSLLGLYKIAEARAKVHMNEKDIHLQNLCEYARSIKIKFCESSCSRWLAEIFLALGQEHFSEAQDWIDKSIEQAAKNKKIFDLGMNLALKAEYCKRKGDIAGSREKFGKAIGILKECGADGWVEKYEKELAATA